ncbi:MAG: hypothetical protein HZC28_14825 [Spirochaetes bacterium]|nr:hypothetical protein [Spirochaetota bacterium]
MSTLESLLNDPRLTDAAIQDVLRVTDPQVFERAILGLSERHRRVFLRNMSIRANDIVRDHIAKLAGSVSMEDCEQAQQEMVKKIAAELEKRTERRKELILPELEKSLSDHRMNDVVIQRALRNVDSRVLACALSALPEQKQEIFFRNMPQRAVRMTRTTIVEEGNAFCEREIREAQGLLADFIAPLLEDERMRQPVGNAEPERLPPLPAFRLNDEEEIIRTFMTLSWYIKKHGMLSIEDAGENTENQVFRKGIDLLVDGWEPMTSRALLENVKKAYLAAVERRVDMILEGFAGLQDGIETAALEEKLRSHTI